MYARYDLTFPVTLSKFLVNEFRRRGIEHEVAVLPCGHYSTGVTPFKWIRRDRVVPVLEQKPLTSTPNLPTSNSQGAYFVPSG